MNIILLLMIFSGVAAQAAAAVPAGDTNSRTDMNKEIQIYISAMNDYYAIVKTANTDMAHFSAGTNNVPEEEQVKAKAEAQAQLRNNLKLMMEKLEIARGALNATLSKTKSNSELMLSVEGKLADYIAGRSSWLVKWEHKLSPAKVERYRKILAKMMEKRAISSATNKTISELATRLQEVVNGVQERIKTHKLEVDRINTLLRPRCQSELVRAALFGVVIGTAAANSCDISSPQVLDIMLWSNAYEGLAQQEVPWARGEK